MKFNHKKMLRAARSNRGLTLAELMVVIALLGVLATIVFGTLTGVLDDAKGDAARVSIKQIEQAVEIYKLKKNKYPGSLEDASKYMRDQRVPKDPWDQEFEYSTNSSCGKSYEIVSKGSDGQRGGEDDVSNCVEEAKD